MILLPLNKTLVHSFPPMTDPAPLISAPCESKAYQKSDGKFYCGFTIKAYLNWYQAADACKTRGGRLPEVYSFEDNLSIMQQKVKYQ